MNPLDALNPKISDEKLVISYAESITDLVTDDYTVSDVIHDDRIWSHQWLTDLILLIFEGDKECLEDWPAWPQKVKELHEEVKRLRESLYKCWKDSEQSLHYLQVELLNDQEYWYEQMICDDDSKRCGDYGIEDCECDEE